MTDEELSTNVNELRGMGHSVADIAKALRISQAEALRLLARPPDG